MRKFEEIYKSIMEKRLNAIEARLMQVTEERKAKESVLEKLAKLEHDQWMKWAKDIMKKEDLSEERVNRWEEECFMPYDDLSEDMKEFDREWARKVLKIMDENKNE